MPLTRTSKDILYLRGHRTTQCSPVRSLLKYVHMALAILCQIPGGNERSLAQGSLCGTGIEQHRTWNLALPHPILTRDLFLLQEPYCYYLSLTVQARRESLTHSDKDSTLRRYFSRPGMMRLAVSTNLRSALSVRRRRRGPITLSLPLLGCQ
ncbi:hypothetical protein GY45DRAFT_347370 [Cubamyces sp. BRFM 1775]|nr:hypothetical protein GY45DRAFT_347370 [Cubamyces sp. BRFM 1775]